MRGCAKKLVCRVEYLMILKYYFKTKEYIQFYILMTQIFAVITNIIIFLIGGITGFLNSLLMTIHYDRPNEK